MLWLGKENVNESGWFPRLILSEADDDDEDDDFTEMQWEQCLQLYVIDGKLNKHTHTVWQVWQVAAVACVVGLLEYWRDSIEPGNDQTGTRYISFPFSQSASLAYISSSAHYLLIYFIPFSLPLPFFRSLLFLLSLCVCKQLSNVKRIAFLQFALFHSHFVAQREVWIYCLAFAVFFVVDRMKHFCLFFSKCKISTFLVMRK